MAVKIPYINKVLILQTAFIGDVVLSTSVIESLYDTFPDAKIDFLLRKGNEGLLHNHPKLRLLWIWNKKEHKTRNQLKLIRELRKEKYDVVINLQRFMSSGIFTVLSAAKLKIGFKKNPLSFAFHISVDHRIEEGVHELDRNYKLLEAIGVKRLSNMRLYPDKDAFSKINTIKSNNSEYIVIAPTSVWYTKQFPATKWVDFIQKIPKKYNVYFIGSPNDEASIEKIIQSTTNRNCINLCGDLTLMESTALMEGATMNFVNDSAPLHMASAMNAPVTAVFCSTVKEFGFGPRSEKSFIVETNEALKCRPCGLHGRKNCPEEHFNCANTINTDQLLIKLIDDTTRN